MTVDSSMYMYLLVDCTYSFDLMLGSVLCRTQCEISRYFFSVVVEAMLTHCYDRQASRSASPNTKHDISSSFTEVLRAIAT
jgi:hypothetical protein